MTTLATLTVKVIGDTADFENKMTKSTSFVDSAVSKMKSAGTVLTASVTAPLVLMGIKSIDAASDMNESMSKVQVVFGDTADSVVEFSKTSDSALGLSQQKALEATGTFGNLFDAMGVGEQAGTDMSIGLVKLASDLASFNNIDPTEALEKLRSGIVGETEPMRALGVNLMESTVQAKALEMGLADSSEELTFQDKVLARYQLILEQTKNSQGDFARTSSGFANSQRIVKAQIENLSASIGSILLPYAQRLLEWVRQGIAWFQRLSPEAQRIAVMIAVIAAAVGPLLLALGFLIPAISAVAGVIGTLISVALSPLGLIIAVIIGLVALLYLAWTNNWGGIQEKTAAVIEFIKTLIAGFVEEVKAWWDQHGADVIATVQNLWNTVQTLFASAVSFLKANIAAALEFIKGWWDRHGASVMIIVNALWNLIKTVFNLGLTFIRNLITTVLDYIKGFWERHGEAITARLSATWETLKTLVKAGMEFIGQIIDAIASLIQGDWDGFWEHIKNAANIAWEAIKTAFNTAKANLLTVVRTLLTEIKNAWNGVNWGDLGKKIVDGVVKAITDGIGRVISAVKRLAQAAVDAVKGVLKVKSPSLVFQEIGENIVKGFLIPLEDRDRAKTAAKKFVEPMKNLPDVSRVSRVINQSTDQKTEIHYHLNTTTKYESEESIIDKLRILQLIALPAS